MAESNESTLQRSSRRNDAVLVLWGTVNSKDVDEVSLNDWWTNEHLPERLSIPGFSRARRYCALDEAAQATHYLTLYDVEDLSTLTSAAYMDKLNNPTAGTKRHIPTLATMNRSACSLIHTHRRSEISQCGPGAGATIVMLVFTTNEGSVPEEIYNEVMPTLSSLQIMKKDFTSFSILQEDIATTETGSTSRSYDNVQLQSRDAEAGTKCIVLLEFSTPARAITDIRVVLQPFINELRSIKGEIYEQTYEFMCSINESTT